MPFVNRYLTSLFFSTRFYWSLAIIACLFALAFLLPPLFIVMKFLFFLFVALVLLDYIILFFTSNAVTATRQMADRFSNGEQNTIKIKIVNQFPFKASLRIIDELPVQFQKRDFLLKTSLE